MDFDACFQVLAARPAHAHTHCEGAGHDDTHHINEEAQVQALADALDAQLGASNDSNATEQKSDVNAAGVQHNDSPPFAELSARALAQAFFKLQETRVQIYNDFHKGFDKHQQTAFFTEFSAGITARFAAVSSTINSIEQTLVAKQQRVLAQCIRKVQLQEKEKLLMTSALLVEQMRLRDALQQLESDASIVSLLEQSVESLQRKLAAIVERINELLDELRAEVVDLEDDGDDEAGQQ